MEVLRYVTEVGQDVWASGLRVERPRPGHASRPGSPGWRWETLATASRCAKACASCGSIGGRAIGSITALAGRSCVLLLCGGDKRKQAADIKRAVRYWEDYKRRTGRA